MLDKLLGKKSGYYLELSEEEIAAIPEPAATPAPKKVATVAQSVVAKAAAAIAPKAADSTEKTAQPEAQPAVVTAPMTDTVELIRTAIAAAANKPKPAAPEPAPKFDYTTPVAKASRRRPGPSMSPFKTMAKDMRKTTAGF
ncbi:MAG: hypothetical protein AAGA83_08335 [Cyanobacteria bacterium P01_F01_bin.116]